MTGLHDEGVASLLYAASDNAPPSRLNIHQAMRDGRRRRRRRLVLAPAIAALAVLALAGGITAAVRPIVADSPVGAAATPAPSAFDPSVSHVSLNLPEPHRVLERSVTETSDYVDFDYLESPGSGGSPVAVVLYAAGISPWEALPPEPWLRRGDPAHPGQVPVYTEPAPPVNGRTARWILSSDVVSSGRTTHGIAWEWAPGGWAAVFSYIAVDESSRMKALHHVASLVRTDVAQPMRFPFTVPAPAGWRHVTSQVGDSGYTLGFDRSGARKSVLVHPGADEVGIQVAVIPASVIRDDDPTPTQVLGGHPAAVQAFSDRYEVTLFGVDGYRVRVTVNSAGDLALMSPERANELALSVRILAPWSLGADQSQWTTDPLT